MLDLTVVIKVNKRVQDHRKHIKVQIQTHVITHFTEQLYACMILAFDIMYTACMVLNSST